MSAGNAGLIKWREGWPPEWGGTLAPGPVAQREAQQPGPRLAGTRPDHHTQVAQR